MHLARAEVCKNRISIDLGLMKRDGAIDDVTFETITQALDDPKALRARLRSSSKYTKPAPDAPLSIVFACGQTLEGWNPDVMAERGLGGSETAVIEMAKRFATAGHSVRVYANVGDEIVRDGVHYLRSGKLFASEACDVLVAWRSASLLEPDAGPVTVGMRVLWVHDAEAAHLTPGRALLADKVFALSAWHRDHLIKTQRFAPSQVVQTRNGVDLTRFDVPGIERHPHRAIYSSSADRGLEVVLDVWPSVRAQVPDAELHVFYGFDTWEKVVERTGDKAAAAEMAEIKAKAAVLADQGVVLRGRVDQKTLAREMLAAGVWVHPSWTRNGPFFETSCIGAAEAIAAGCAVVCRSHGALAETTGGSAHTWVSYGEPGDKWMDNSISRALLTTTDLFREYAREAGSRLTWDTVPGEWLAIFRAFLASDEVHLPEYVTEAAE